MSTAYELPVIRGERRMIQLMKRKINQVGNEAIKYQPALGVTREEDYSQGPAL